MAKNAFNEASKIASKPKEVATDTKAKKPEPLVVIISDKDVPGFSKTLSSMVSKKAEIKKATVDLKPLDEIVRKVSLDSWLSLIKDGKERPTSLKIVSDDEESKSSISFVSADAYKSVKAEKAITLRKVYGNDVVTEDNVFTFDADMLKKYNVLLSKFILQSPDIDSDDRAKIIVCTKAYAVASGTINKLPELAKKANKDLSEVIADFGPTFQLQDA